MKWAVKWRSKNRLDGVTEYLVGDGDFHKPAHLSGYYIAVFRTRELARNWVSKNFGYITHRPDLRREPHGWTTPQIVKVKVSVEEVA